MREEKIHQRIDTNTLNMHWMFYMLITFQLEMDQQLTQLDARLDTSNSPRTVLRQPPPDIFMPIFVHIMETHLFLSACHES